MSWTLKYELYFYGVCALILCLPRPYRLAAALGWLLYMLFGQWLCNRPWLSPCSPSLFLTMHPISFEFAVGALVGYAYVTESYPRWAPKFLFALGVGALLAAFAGYVLFEIDLDRNRWNRVLLFGLPAALLVFGATLAKRDRRCRVPKWLVRLGDASYTYYLSHLLVIQALFWVLAPIAWLTTALIIAIAFATSWLVAGVGYRYTEQPLLRLAYRDDRRDSGVAAKPD